GLAILRGNLAPEGAVIKIAGVTKLVHRGPARVFDGEAACAVAVEHRQIQPGDVGVIRYEGPKGGPGMREMLSVTAAAGGPGAGDAVREGGAGGPGAGLRVRAHHRRPL